MEFRLLCLGEQHAGNSPAAPIKAGEKLTAFMIHLNPSVHLFGSEHVLHIVSGVPITLKELEDRQHLSLWEASPTDTEIK